MKVLVASIGFALIAFAAIAQIDCVMPEEEMERFKTYYNTCLEEFPLNETVIENAVNGILEEDEPLLGEFLFCVNKKTGVQNEKGELQAESIRQKLKYFIKSEELGKLIEKCVKNKEEPKQTALEYFKCGVDFLVTSEDKKS